MSLVILILTFWNDFCNVAKNDVAMTCGIRNSIFFENDLCDVAMTSEFQIFACKKCPTWRGNDIGILNSKFLTVGFSRESLESKAEFWNFPGTVRVSYVIPGPSFVSVRSPTLWVWIFGCLRAIRPPPIARNGEECLTNRLAIAV